MDKLDMQTPNIADKNFEELAMMFPNAVTETITGYDKDGKAIVERAIDADVLRQEISATVVEGKDERYQFTWPDKKKAVLMANTPINATLRPCRDDSVDFDKTENLYIEGDNLDVLKLLQETYLGKIKLIYIDPPYNTGNDFIYDDNFTEVVENYLSNSGQYDNEGNRLVQNTESNGRFHTDWLNMIYSRLKLAKNLLSDDGVICISIDDNELFNLKQVCDEIFGADNFINNVVVKMSEASGLKMSHVETRIPKLKEYVLIYKKKDVHLNPIKIPKDDWDKEYRTYIENISDDDLIYVKEVLQNENRKSDEVKRCNEILNNATYVSVNEKYKEYRITSDEDKKKYNYDNAGRIFQTVSMGAGATKDILESRKKIGNSIFFVHVTSEGKGYLIKGDYDLETRKPRMQVLFAEDYLTVNPCDFWQDIKTTGLDNEGYISFKNGKKPLKLIQRLIELNTKEDDIVLDFFSGSATTAQALMELNARENTFRKFILVQLPEEIGEKDLAYKEGFRTIPEIGKERIRRVGTSISKSNSSVDIGFRAFKVDSSNMKDVFYNPSETQQTLFDLYADNIKEDRTPEDLLFQVMLGLGVLLSSKIEKTEIAGKKVFNVADGFLIACFDKDVTEETVKAVAQKQPYYAVFRDSSMANDSVATNFEQIFATYSPETVRKVL